MGREPHLEEQDDEHAVVSGFARTFRIAIVLLVIMIGTIGVWAWLSSGSDANLPFGYGGFD